MKSRLWRPPAEPVAETPSVRAGAADASTLYAALDLGTNNCRLLIARPGPRGFRIVDSFSRIVRLGEGLAADGRMAQSAMDRAVDALKICQDRLETRGVVRRRLIATEACRQASNGEAFLDRVRAEAGLDLEVIDRRTEAELAAAGCATLMAKRAPSVMLFDIGGGSTEVVWLMDASKGKTIRRRIRKWTSLPVGVVTLAERYGGVEVDGATYQRMVDEVSGLLASFAAPVDLKALGKHFHLLGTSGTVTTIAAMHLDLPRYDRKRVDGLWMKTVEAEAVVRKLLATPFQNRADNPCIGSDRADLVLAGCAIYEAIARAFPAEWIRIADRGLREGILMQLMSEDGLWNGPEEALP